jgi:hypothetical protein
MNHYVTLALTNMKSSLHLHALYSPRTALRMFTLRRDHLMVCLLYQRCDMLCRSLSRCFSELCCDTNMYLCIEDLKDVTLRGHTWSQRAWWLQENPWLQRGWMCLQWNLLFWWRFTFEVMWRIYSQNSSEFIQTLSWLLRSQYQGVLRMIKSASASFIF